MVSNYKNRLVYYSLSVVAGSLLSIYAWRFASHETLGIFFGLSLMLTLMIIMGSGLREWFLALGLGVISMLILTSLLGAYTLVNPGYRAWVAADANQKEAQSAENQAQTNQTEQLLEGVDLTKKPKDNHRTGKILLFWERKGYPKMVDLSDWFSDLDQTIKTTQLADASTLALIKETTLTVGTYHPKIIGPIYFPISCGKALKYTWTVWLVDVKTKKVTAYKEFPGPTPPDKSKSCGDSGINPSDEEIAAWLESLPVQ
jgi:hypothetical protein